MPALGHRLLLPPPPWSMPHEVSCKWQGAYQHGSYGLSKRSRSRPSSPPRYSGSYCRYRSCYRFSWPLQPRHLSGMLPPASAAAPPPLPLTTTTAATAAAADTALLRGSSISFEPACSLGPLPSSKTELGKPHCCACVLQRVMYSLMERAAGALGESSRCEAAMDRVSVGADMVLGWRGRSIGMRWTQEIWGDGTRGSMMPLGAERCGLTNEMRAPTRQKERKERRSRTRQRDGYGY
jgi:hypothetical protein